MFPIYVKKRVQKGQNNKEKNNNSCASKKNIIGFYTEDEPITYQPRGPWGKLSTVKWLRGDRRFEPFSLPQNELTRVKISKRRFPNYFTAANLPYCTSCLIIYYNAPQTECTAWNNNDGLFEIPLKVLFEDQLNTDLNTAFQKVFYFQIDLWGCL